MTKLVIVESPSKAKTIGKYLGPGYMVRASMGHIRDLPPRELGVDVEHGFKPTYHILSGKRKTAQDLRQRIGQADEIYLATDLDREGEAIAWHVLEVAKAEAKGKPIHRVSFSEITPAAIQAAFHRPRKLDQALVDAQQARRILDRLVGYQISPLLWKKLRSGLSAGRVQSVAVRLVVDREREIEAFVPQEFWTVEADLSKVPACPETTFRATLIKIRGKSLDKFALKTQRDAQAIIDDLQGAAYRVLDVQSKEVRRRPQPPFITSTMQRQASSKLGMAPGQAMQVAQQLYEGVDVAGEGHTGLITYMRTDSPSTAPEAQAEARAYIEATWGPEYLPAQPPVYAATAAGAQEAHECIRPTKVERTPAVLQGDLTADQFRLYELIWCRFVASQMADAELRQTTVDVAAGKPSESPAPYIFRATGSVLTFPGWLVVYEEEPEEEGEEGAAGPLPPLAKDEPLELVQLLPVQHFTKPPPRYNEATLIKELEKRGIGRPSTFAGIVQTIQERGYVEKLEPAKRKSPLRPTDTGLVVNDLLVLHFPDILDYGFTAEMETRLDQIAAGQRPWKDVLTEFYGPFQAALTKADQEMAVVRGSAPTELTCAKCGRPLVVRQGKQGEFLACSGYPECQNTREFRRGPDGAIVLLDDLVGEQVCPECGQPMTVRRGRTGYFLGCTAYPACRELRSLSPEIQEQFGAVLSSAVPSGRRSASQDPQARRPKKEASKGKKRKGAEERICPECGRPLVERKGKHGRFWGCSGYPRCRYTEPWHSGK